MQVPVQFLGLLWSVMQTKKMSLGQEARRHYDIGLQNT